MSGRDNEYLSRTTRLKALNIPKLYQLILKVLIHPLEKVVHILHHIPFLFFYCLVLTFYYLICHSTSLVTSTSLLSFPPPPSPSLHYFINISTALSTFPTLLPFSNWPSSYSSLNHHTVLFTTLLYSSFTTFIHLSTILITPLPYQRFITSPYYLTHPSTIILSYSQHFIHPSQLLFIFSPYLSLQPYFHLSILTNTVLFYSSFHHI